MAYIDTAFRRKDKLIKAIDTAKDIPEYNKQILRDYVRHMNGRGLNPRTIIKHLYSLSIFLKALGPKNLKSATKAEIQDAFGFINDTKYSASVKQQIKTSTKCFYKYLLGDDEYYPRQISWLKTGIPVSVKRIPEEMITETEALKMINASLNLRDRAIVALLWETGIRVGELLDMRIKNVDLSSDPAHVQVFGKTGGRKIPILFASSYLAQYVNSLTDKGPEEYLWKSINNERYNSTIADYSSIRVMLRKLSRKAEVIKRVNPHNFRHSAASRLANLVTEAQLKGYFGWSGDTKMASVYVHLSGRDLDDAYLKANGIKLNHTDDKRMAIKSCKKCTFTNDSGSTYCARCGSALDTRTAMNDIADKEILNKVMAEFLKNPKQREELIHSILMEEYKRKKG